MFESRRYATRGVASEVPLDTQIVLWGLIDERKHRREKLDYLQTFELSIECRDGEELQKVVHSQEVPAFSETSYFRLLSQPITRRVWVIDSGDYATMLFPEEY